MEYRNFYNTPREMVDDEMLERLLEEREPGSKSNCPLCRGNSRMGQRQYGNGNGMRNSSGGNMNGNMGGNMNGKPNCRGEYQTAPVANMNPTWSNPCLEGNPLAMVYSPCQEWDGLYEVEEALCRGTLFKALDLNFYPACCSK